MPSGSSTESAVTQVPEPACEHLPAEHAKPVSQSESVLHEVLHAASAQRYGEQLVLAGVQLPLPLQPNPCRTEFEAQLDGPGPWHGFGAPGYFRIAYCVDRAMIERSFDAWRALALELGLNG